MRTRSLAAALAAAALLLAGCSGGPGAASPSPTSSATHANQAAAMLAVSRCMRGHGYPNFPDPVQQPDGRWDWPPVVDHLSVSTACDDLVRQAKSASRQTDRKKVDAATLAKLRQYAQCMREHGVADWPDPNDVGAFKVPARLQPRSAEALWGPADRQCQRFVPPGGIVLEQERR